ncbi:hypothetical protein VKT23_000176 [Stygiomarasmius scandens]|uniref:G domain-containing protein n=1 Tax=Marasmiellus scandens TaxID=2682957 RepID=A0ABR1K4F0_9AGAR
MDCELAVTVSDTNNSIIQAGSPPIDSAELSPPIASESEHDTRYISSADVPSLPNIVLFGASGCGKTSIINMLAGFELAKTVSNSAVSLFHNEKYTIKIEDQAYNIHDTTGLSEGHDRSSLSQEAKNQLKGLIRNLDDGISLLVFCLRAPRITDGAAKNYAMFYRELCGSRVPIVIVVTGLENEIDTEEWWVTNEHVFKGYGMHFDGHARITATKGKETANGYKNQEEYDKSRERTALLIKQHAQKPRVKVNSKGISERIRAVMTSLTNLKNWFSSDSQDTVTDTSDSGGGPMPGSYDETTVEGDFVVL